MKKIIVLIGFLCWALGVSAQFGGGVTITSSGGKIDTAYLTNDTLVIVESGDTTIVSGVGGGGGGVKTFLDYAELRSYTGADSVVVVKNFGTTIGGMFVREYSGTENGGTLIIADNSVRWKRVCDPKIIHANWFEVDSLGYATSTTKYCLDSGMKVKKAALAAGTGGVIVLNGSYFVSETITLYEGQTLDGNNSLVKRKNPIVTTLTATATAGNNTLNIASVDGLRVGMYIAARSSSSYDSLTNYQSYITGIVGNVVTVSENHLHSMYAGDTVFTSTPIVYADDLDNVTIENVIFQGNRLENKYTYDWRCQNYTISVSRTENPIIKGCEFYNTPNENIYICKGLVDNVKYDSLNGSFGHITCAALDTLTPIIFKNVVGSNSNLIPNATTGHSEAVITYSNYSINVVVEDCQFVGGTGYVFSPMGTDDYTFRVERNTFKNFTGIVTSSEANGDRKDFIFRNNTAILCGDIYLRGTDLTSNPKKRLDRIIITGNYFLRTRIGLYNVTNVDICDNTLQMPLGTTSNAYYSSSLVSSAPGVIGIGTGFYQDLKIVNNVIIGDTLASAYLQGGVFFAVNPARGTGLYAKIYYPQAIQVSFNKIENFRYGITTVDYGTSVITKQLTAWEFSHNDVTIIRDSSYLLSNAGYGIYAYPGVIVKNNTCRSQLRMNNSVPLAIFGIDESAGADTSVLHGAIAINNVLIGTNRTLMVSTNSSNTLNQYNCLAEGNICIGALPINYTNYNSVGYRSYVGNNIVLNTSLLPAFSNQKLFKIYTSDQ